MGSAVSNTTKKGWLTCEFNHEQLARTSCMLISLALAILELGAWFGTLYSGVLAERISRKYTIVVNVIIFCIGVIIQWSVLAAARK